MAEQVVARSIPAPWTHGWYFNRIAENLAEQFTARGTNGPLVAAQQFSRRTSRLFRRSERVHCRQHCKHFKLRAWVSIIVLPVFACARDSGGGAAERVADAAKQNGMVRQDSGAAAASTAVGYASPENLVYDSAADVFLVANVNGGAVARDSNGFLSRVGSDGRIIALKWIDGTRPATRLDGPKGLAIRGDTLAVSDVGAVRLFDRRTGAPLGVWPVPGELMNDVAFAPDGTLYVTDTGPGPGLPNTSDRDAIYHFATAGHPTAMVTGSDLAGPDGIVVSDTDVVYSTFGADRVVRIPRFGARTNVATLPGGKVDGLRRLPDGSYVVTSWDAHSVFRLLSNGTRRTELTGVTSPAGVAYDSRRNRLAVTSMQGNRLYLVSLK